MDAALFASDTQPICTDAQSNSIVINMLIALGLCLVAGTILTYAVVKISKSSLSKPVKILAYTIIIPFYAIAALTLIGARFIDSGPDCAL